MTQPRGSRREKQPDMLEIRVFQPHHRDGIIQLIDSVYQEHGDSICLENADQDLTDIPQRYRNAGGEFVVLEDAEAFQVWGCHAVLPLDHQPGLCTFRRLYLSRKLRGQGWGLQLMNWALQWSLEHGFHTVEFWSDSRFQRAHQFFESLGFRRDGRVRSMNDGHLPYEEYFFWKSLS